MAKVLVSFDDGLLRRIDQIARSRGITRSAYLALLAERDASTAGSAVTVQRALEVLDRLFATAPPGDSTALVREERDAH